jgi:hypothetical protein
MRHDILSTRLAIKIIFKIVARLRNFMICSLDKSSNCMNYLRIIMMHPVLLVIIKFFKEQATKNAKRKIKTT